MGHLTLQSRAFGARQWISLCEAPCDEPTKVTDEGETPPGTSGAVADPWTVLGETDVASSLV